MSTPPETADPYVCPKLRPGLTAEPAGEGYLILDRLRVARSVELTPLGVEIAQRFDGSRTLTDVQHDVMNLVGGTLIPLDAIAELARGLDEALLLDSPRFHEYISGPIRKPSCIGCYDADPAKLRSQLTRLFTAPDGPGMPDGSRPRSHGKLRAALLPHMDYARGNITYGWGFKELIEQTDARVFVIVATSHYSLHRFTLTRQHFETPLGVVPTDQDYVREIEKQYGPGAFDDPFAHLPEHSVELEVVLLQFLLEGRRDFKIVPLVVGSFGDCVDQGKSPAETSDIPRMAEALRQAEAACDEPVCYLISGDLAHIGPKFGDRQKAAEPWLAESREWDKKILEQVGRADPAAYFDVIASEGDCRRICGLPPTWLTLTAARPTKGRVLNYQQFVHPQGFESVSFAAAAFYE